jgi:hypothetical protein
MEPLTPLSACNSPPSSENGSDRLMIGGLLLVILFEFSADAEDAAA